MASELTLEINGRKRDILRYNYRFHREIQYNRPVDSIWGGEICVEMTSDGDTYFLERLMAEKEVIKETSNGTRETFTVPASVSGKIQFIKENEIFRELAFQEAYIVFYGERMSSVGPKSMSTFLVISPMKMEVNKRVMMVKRQDSGINLGWVQKVEEKPKPTPVTPYTPPTLLVRTVNGEAEALTNAVIEYKVTSYNLSNVSDSDRKRVKWDIEVDGKRETLTVKGETINLTMKEEWVNKEITVMPYLKTPDENVSVKTKVLYEPQIRLIITNQATGYTIQRLKGDSGWLSKNVVIVQTYRVDVFNYEQYEKNFEFSFNVTRDAWYNLGIEKDTYKTFNRAFIPADWSKNLYGAMWIPSYPKFSGMGAFILTRYGERKLPAKPLLTQQTLEGKPIDSPRNNENFATDVMIHVGGVYEIMGVDYLGGSYGCFGFIPNDDTYASIEQAKNALENNLYSKKSSNEEWKKITNKILNLSFPQQKKIRVLLEYCNEKYKPEYVYNE